MLKTRLISAAVLLGLCYCVLFRGSIEQFSYASLFLCLLAAYEWGRLLKLKNYQLLAFLGFSCVLMQFTHWSFAYHSQVLKSIACLLWIFLSYQVIRYPANQTFLRQKWLGLAFGLSLFALCFVSLSALRVELGPTKLLYVLSLSWISDTGAYFSGRRFGKHLLCPKVSPGKTWEGVAGGLSLVAIWAYGAAQFFGVTAPFYFISVSLISSSFSIMGDLFESLYKRLAEVKNSGRLIPGHGGVLDRIDSLLAAVPIFWALQGPF